MNRRRFFIFLLLLSFQMGCHRVQVIKTGSTVTRSLPATNPEEITIFRSALPSWSYEEIGVVTVSNIPKIDVVYEKMRKEAAKRGAVAIIDFKLDSDSRTVPVTQTHSGPNGATYTTTSMQTQVMYTASGSLIHKVEEK